MTTSVTRDVYRPNGKLLYHDTWYSSYRALPKLVRIGPSLKKKKKKKPKQAQQPGATTTTTSSTTTSPTTTQPGQ
jgi:hypothetical protein